MNVLLHTFSIHLSADVMRSLGAQTIIAVDVGSVYEPHQTNYGDSLSGWWLLWNKWNPFGSTVKVFTQCIFLFNFQVEISHPIV